MPLRPLNDLRLLQLLAPAFLAAVGTFAVVPALASGKLPPVEDLQRTGTIRSWRLDADGALYIELESASAGGTKPAQDDPKDAPILWFRTPPTGDQHPSFNDLALQVVLASTRPGVPRPTLTVTAKLERALSGASPEEALPLLALASP